MRDFRKSFKNNTTMKDTEIDNHYPVKQKARPTPLPLPEGVGKVLEKLIKPEF